jgi:hypothetical protein
MSQNPRALILTIEKKGATDYSCLENRSGAKYKVFTVTFLIFNIIIFRFDGFQPHHTRLKYLVQMWCQTCTPGISMMPL